MLPRGVIAAISFGLQLKCGFIVTARFGSITPVTARRGTGNAPLIASVHDARCMTTRLLIGIAGTLVLAAAWSLAAHETPDIRLHPALQSERLEPPLLGVQMKLERGSP
jgi:hypothetical protein